MKITINDRTIDVPEATTLAEALTLNNINTRGIATAVNDTVVASADREKHVLSDGDKILIIKAFYGG